MQHMDRSTQVETQAPLNLAPDWPAVHTGLSRVTPSCNITQVIYGPPGQSSTSNPFLPTLTILQRRAHPH